jgi:hypothetical protein
MAVETTIILRRQILTKKINGIFIGFVIVMVATLFASCSSFPTMSVKSLEVSYDVLGYVGNTFSTYDEAFTAAKAKYPQADAVVRAKAKMDDKSLAEFKLFSRTGFVGYYAVKFNQAEPREKFLGIF